MTGRWVAMVATGLLAASPASSLELDLPANARETFSNNDVLAAYQAPTGVFGDGALPHLRVEGEVRRSAFRLRLSGLTPLQVLAPLRAQLEAAGLTPVFECASAACGGFDFRFATEILPAPDMIVNLRAFHYLTALEGEPEAPRRVVTLLASTSADAAYLQVIQAGDLGNDPDQFTRAGEIAGPVAPTEEPPAPAADDPVAVVSLPGIPPEGSFEDRLINTGAVTLHDVQFQTGSDGLSDSPAQTLEELAQIMRARPSLRIALVGHTDSVGSLDANIALSRRRAVSVRQRMIDGYGIDAARIEAQGVGYLAPISSNLTDVGRALNRRVEAVVLSQDE